jgi:TatA/E family protein of Tat protein translocase
MPAAVLAAAPAPALAFLDSIGGMEMMLVAVIGLLLFGGKGLPDMARTLGKVIREFKKATANVEEEVKRVMNEEPAPAPKPRPRPTPRALPDSPASTPDLPPPPSPPAP